MLVPVAGNPMSNQLSLDPDVPSSVKWIEYNIFVPLHNPLKSSFWHSLHHIRIKTSSKAAIASISVFLQASSSVPYDSPSFQNVQEGDGLILTPRICQSPSTISRFYLTRSSFGSSSNTMCRTEVCGSVQWINYGDTQTCFHEGAFFTVPSACKLCVPQLILVPFTLLNLSWSTIFPQLIEHPCVQEVYLFKGSAFLDIFYILSYCYPSIGLWQGERLILLE